MEPQVGHVQAAEPDWFVIADLTFTVVRLYGTVDLLRRIQRNETNLRMSHRACHRPNRDIDLPCSRRRQARQHEWRQ